MFDTYQINARVYKKYEERYIKISKNQLRIMEALMKDGFMVGIQLQKIKELNL